MVPTKEEIELAKDIVVNLLEKGANKNLTSPHSGFHSFSSWMKEEGMEHYGFKWYYGITKACLDHSDLERWVIKFSFKDLRYDYCEIEFENYCKAEEVGYSHYFPATYFLAQIYDVNFYLQEKAEEAEEEISDVLYEKMTDELIAEGEDPEDEWFGDLVAGAVDDLDDVYKIEILFGDCGFAEFLRENRINDLHSGNFGFVDGHLVIIDFSGFKGI